MSARLRFAAVCAALCMAGSAAFAQGYPSRPVRFVVPYSPGGSADTLARTLSASLTERLGQQVVVDNRTGANGDIGMALVARAQPDGYTIVLGYIGNLGIGPAWYAQMPYDPLKDFTSITQAVGGTNMLVVHPSVPAKTLREFIAYTKANPKKVTFASAGVASVGHMTGELLNTLAGIDLTHVPYKGTGQAITDLLGGHIKVMIGGFASSLIHVRSGKLHGIATTGLRRTPAAPDIPTIAESGFPGFETSSWFGVLGPAKLPRPIVMRLNGEIGKSLHEPAAVKRLEGVGFEIVTGTPEAFTAYMKSEIAKWTKVIKSGTRAKAG